MLRHFHGLYSHRPYLSTNQRSRIRSVIVKYKVLLFINTTCQSVAIVAVTICMMSSVSLRGRPMQKNIHLHLSQRHEKVLSLVNFVLHILSQSFDPVKFAKSRA